MVTLLKNNSSQGIYILIEEDGQIANNTPGEIDLENLTLGTNYIYFDSVMRFEYRLSFTSDGGESWVGHNLSAFTPGAVEHWTGQADKGNVVVLAEVDETTAYWAARFGKQNNRTTHDKGAGQRFLVKQTASNTFRQFPSDGLAALNYMPIVISGCDIIEMEGINDRQQLMIGMWETQLK